MLVEATVGLGEPLVAGTITPDAWEVSRAGEIIHQRIGSKRKALVKHHGALDDALDDRRRRAPSLTVPEVLKVATLARALEDELGAPQDVEWALTHKGELVLLQARPVTTAGAIDRSPSSS